MGAFQLYKNHAKNMLLSIDKSLKWICKTKSITCWK